MAIAPTGAIYKSLSFDGEDSRNYGVYITGEAVYNAPERDVEMITIPGRNGSFALDNGRFQNIEVSYPAGIFADTEADFRQAVSDFRNFLCSRKGYVRLQDEYNPDEYRMAVYKSGLEVDPAMLKAGEFTITFDCKPQRWLVSGESAVAVDSGDTLTNPTLFESSPLLEIEGYGTIEFNGYEIEIDNTDLGEVVVYPRSLPRANITITIDTQYLNQGDSIYFGKGNNDLYFSYSFGSGTYKTYAGTVSSQVNVKDASITNYSSYGLTFKMSPDTGTGFVYGTPRTINSSLVFYYTNNNIQYPQTVNTSISYDGNDSITFSYARTGTESSDIHIDTNPYVCINKIYAFSTSPIDIGTIYVDCDLGECYLEESGTITPINQQVDLGSRLPTLASGTNEIIFDNTITELNIAPRWWKI